MLSVLLVRFSLFYYFSYFYIINTKASEMIGWRPMMYSSWMDGSDFGKLGREESFWPMM